MKYAVFSMDIEDWYHLAYFNQKSCNCSTSLLDGIGIYKDIIDRHGIKSTFFVLGELITNLTTELYELANSGHDIAAHGWNHALPMDMTLKTFADDIRHTKAALEDAIGMPVNGYRAPCFSLDRTRLDTTQEIGYTFDSSRILFKDHPFYGTLDMNGFEHVTPSIYRQDKFFEFQTSTLPLVGKNIPVSGGGYLRIFPWFLMRRLIQGYLRQHELYVLYIHPFELSSQPPPQLPSGTSWTVRKRFTTGRSTVGKKLEALIELLQENGVQFTTFSKLRQTLLEQKEDTD